MIDWLDAATLELAWNLCSAEPGSVMPPRDAEWISAHVPGTVAQALRAHRLEVENIESRDWWWRAELDVADEAGARLTFGGIATIADVWVNDELVASSENAHLAVSVRVPSGHIRIAVCCRALRSHPAPSTPRARWRTRLVEDNRIRWFRSPLAGRIPGWWSGPPVVGLWKPLHLTRGADAARSRIVPSVRHGMAHVTCEVTCGGSSPREVQLVVAGIGVPLAIAGGADGWQATGSSALGDLARWWPHTHGTPVMHDARVEIAGEAGTEVVHLSPLGFREVDFDYTAGRLYVNGVPVFARGACWTAFDPVSAGDDHAALDSLVAQVVDAGMNIVRVTGCFPYVSRRVLAALDRAGVMVMHDLALASLDYPEHVDAWRANFESEVRAAACTWAQHASVVIVGGGSEVAQQPAMLGLSAETWTSAMRDVAIPRWLDESGTDAAWVPTIPGGGAGLPFRADTPVSHYFGVGAYRRDVADIRRAGVKFSAECLAFSHVADEPSLRRVVPPSEDFRARADWLAGTPRDNGADWDFADVRDHYLAAEFGVDPVLLRAEDPERYLALSRVVSGRVVSKALAEMRRVGGATGAIMWWLKDLLPGDGWGVIDAFGAPKPAYWFVRRSLASRAVFLTDEGLNGVCAHVVNDRAEPMEAMLHVYVVSGDAIREHGVASIALGPHDADSRDVEAILGGFRDIGFAYRFGPLKHEAVVARLVDGTGHLLSESWHDVATWNGSVRAEAPAVAATLQRHSDELEVTLVATSRLRAVRIDADGWVPDDAFFDLAPTLRRTVVMRRSRPDIPVPRQLLMRSACVRGDRVIYVAAGDSALL